MNLNTLRNKLFSIYLANRTEGSKRYIFIFELASIFGIYLLCVNLWYKYVEPGNVISNQYIYLGLFNLVSWLLLYRLTILAKLPRTQRFLQIFFNFIRFGFLELIFLFLVKILMGYHEIHPVFIFLYAGTNLFVLYIVRIMTYGIFKIFRANGYDLHHVVVIADSFSDIFIERIINEKEWGFKIDKIFTNSKLIGRKFGKEIPVYPEIREDIEKSLSEEVIDEVIYCKHDLDKADLKELTHLCNEIGVIFRLQSGLSPLETLNLEMETLNNENQIYLSDTPSLRLSLFFKNVSDLYFSFFIQILLIPVYLLIAAIIKIESPGPVFFVQERVGLRGRRFKLYKFRTMIKDAEKVLDELREKNEVDGPVFKIKNDPRITRMGGFLRKTGLDELPQFLNVLRGEMSLIGPRPPLPSEVAQYERWQLRRLSVKPGITCTWQVIPNRNEVKFEHWMKLDLQYIDNWNLQKDVKLFFQTIRTIFMAGGH